jgi:mono/diheme cytochrome c family protein
VILAIFTATVGLLWSIGLVPPGSVANQNEQPAGAAELFLKRCASCHGKDGKAKTFKAKFNSARNLTDSRWQAEVSDERIFNSITNGRNKMPSFGKKLSEPEINSLVVYVRGLKK